MRPRKASIATLGLLQATAASNIHTQPTTASPRPFLNFSSPAPYIFSSINGLFEQWANTFFPNGHTIAACEIPAHTLFYHGRHDTDTPPSPEFLAFDVEMAYGIMGNLPDSRMLTYRTTRPVKCLHFDGTSANLMSTGVEAQMTFLYGDSESVPSRPWPPRPGRPGRGPPPGRSPPGERPADPGAQGDGRRPPFERWNPLDDEYFRANGLCEWIKEKGLGGQGWGFEGIVRMNAAFEIIWCDFDSPSLRLVSNLNVSAPRTEMDEKKRWPDMPSKRLLRSLPEGQVALKDGDVAFQADTPEGPHGPGMTDPSEPFREAANWMWFTAAARHYGASGTHGVGPGRGEARSKVNTCGIFTFYDPGLEGQDTARIEAERTSLNISSDGRWNGPEDEESRAPALEQLMRRRRPHRANHVSKDDGKYMLTAVEEGLRAVLDDERVPGNASCSGIGWQLTTQEIVTSYSANLRNLLQTLGSIPEKSETHWIALRNWLESVRMLTHWFMVPFLEYPRGPYTNESLQVDFSMDSPSIQEAVERCQSQYDTEGMQKLQHGESVLSWAVDETLGGLCHAVFEVGLGVECEWLSRFNQDPQKHKHDLLADTHTWDTGKQWKMAIEELMAWLGWAERWTGCEGPCASNEICYIPMWPVISRGIGGQRLPGADEGRRRPGPPGWGMEDRLWDPVCVNASTYSLQ